MFVTGGQAPFPAAPGGRAIGPDMRGIKAQVISDITPDRVGEYLAVLRREGLPIPEGSKRKPKPLSASSSNHYVRAVRSFCHWLVRDRRVEASPIAGLSAVKTGRDVKRKRRPLAEVSASRCGWRIKEGLAAIWQALS